MSSDRLVMQGVQKRFGATQALAAVDLRVGPGEVLALIGENGAGKSTLMKVLAGVHRPDGGRLQLGGRPYTPADPLDARRQGVVMIYQELTLAPDLSVAENILLGVVPTRFGLFVDGGRRRAMAAQALQRLGREDIDLDQPVGQLSTGQQQMVEIARAMVTTPQVLVLDEPTSSLTRADVEHLFQVIARLREQGVSIIYISHFLEECQEVADRFVVLRDGESVAEGAMDSVTESELIRHMVGRAVDELYPTVPRQAGEQVLSVDGLAGRELPRRVSLELHRGEVLGIFGLVGSGRTEFLRCLFGLDPLVAGSIRLFGEEYRPSAARSWRLRMGMVSESRKDEGLMLVRDLADNLTLSRLTPYRRGPFLHNSAQAEQTARWIDRLGVRTQGPRQPIADLSGGNQQKIAIGRLLHHGCELLVLDEPTRGIDVAAKARIYQLIAEEAADGKAVVVVSSYVPELLGICDRLAVMCRGELSEARPVRELDEHKVMAAAIGQIEEVA